MELRKYIEIVRRRRSIIATTVIVATLVVIVGVLRLTPNYTASATLRVAPRPGAAVDYGVLEYAVRLKNTYADLAVSGPTLETLQQRLGTPNRSLSVLKKNISLEFPTNNELMSVIVRDTDPIVAASIANIMAELLIDIGQQAKINRTFTIELIEPAVVPMQADIMSSAIVIVFAAGVSLVGGVGLALLLESIDTTIYSTPQLKDLLQLPVLAKVPRIRGRKTNQCYNGNSPEGEAFRQLRTSITSTSQSTPAKTIMVTSAEPGEGKTLISANLAYSLAQLQQKVLIVDADLRLPALHKTFSLSNDIGLGNVLHQEVSLEEAIRFVSTKNLYVLTSGTTRSNPADLLSSCTMRSAMEQLVAQFDIVVLDTPAYLAVADSTILSTLADSVLLVVRYDKSQKQNVQFVYEQLVNADVDFLGVVANATEANTSYRYYQQKQP